MTVIVAVGLVCLLAGVWLANWAWKVAVRDTAQGGPPLEVYGKRYRVSEEGAP